MIEKFILLIEDNKAVREALTWALEYNGYRVVATKNGQEALMTLENDPLPAIIFLDLMMPILDGLAFREKQKSISRLRNIPTVISSAKSALENMNKMPHEIILPKPFDLNNVFDIIKKYCN